MKKKCLLIIGAGIEQIRAYELARELGIETVASDINPAAPAFQYADHKIIASTRNIAETVQAARQFNQHHKIHGVMTLANDVPLTVATVAQKLGLPSISTNSARLASDKLAMKKKFKADSVSVPPFMEISSESEIEECAAKWGYPLVIKPTDGRGARGVLRITEDIDKSWALKHAQEDSKSKKVIAEKFIMGKQLSTESMIYKNKCYTASISFRNYELLDRYAPHIIENGGVLPADLDSRDIIAVEEIIFRAAQSMGITRGTVKGDIVLSENGPIVIELAARLSGGYLCTDQIPLARGVDLVKQTIKLALGEDLEVDELIPQDIHKMGIRYFFPDPGRIKRITGFDELDQYDWITRKMLFLKVGDIVELPTNHTKRAGFVHTIGRTYKEANERAITVANSVIIETVPL
jgi:biotin carboxylase